MVKLQNQRPLALFTIWYAMSPTPLNALYYVESRPIAAYIGVYSCSLPTDCDLVVWSFNKSIIKVWLRWLWIGGMVWGNSHGDSARCSGTTGVNGHPRTGSTAHMGTCRQQTERSYWSRAGHSSSLIGGDLALSFPSSEAAFRAHATDCLIAKPVWHSFKFHRNLIMMFWSLGCSIKIIHHLNLLKLVVYSQSNFGSWSTWKKTGRKCTQEI